MRARLLGVLAVPCLAFAACGNDESDSATTEGSTEVSDEAVPTASDGSAASVEATDTSDTAASTPPITGGSECSVTITGDVTADWTSTASGFQAFVYGGWLANPSAEDAAAFAVNCYDEAFNIVGLMAASGVEIPMEPATYAVGGFADPAAQINAELGLLFDEGLWEATSGTLDITEFDDSHIRGTFSLAIEDSFDPTRTADVSGDFAHSR